MTTVYASGWDGRTFPRWPIRPAPACGICDQPGRPYLAGPRCDRHSPGGPPPQTYPINRPATSTGYALDHAHAALPGERRCAAVDSRGRFVCPYPLDPANGDEHTHMACALGWSRVLADVRAHGVRQHTDAARAAVAGRGVA